MMVALAAAPSVTFLTVCFLFATSNVTYGFSPIIPVWKQRQSLTAIPSSTRFAKEDSDDDVDVQVYDNVFSPVACKVIHCLAVEHSFWVNSETSIFLRPPFNTWPLTPLEHVMDSALTALNDSSKLVEYWSREEYMNIDAHVDIDEERLEEEGCLAVPLASHVLYLEVNNTIRGPTCVFPSKRTGWAFEVDETENEKPAVDLVVVPAVQGRILRFPGSAMHAVPKPLDRWLMTDAEERQLREAEQCDNDDEEEFFDDFDEGGEEEDDDDDEEEDIERSVLLFNTWPDDGPAPLGAKNVGCSDSLGGAKDEEQLVREWEEDYGVNAELIRCNPTSDWHEKLLTKGATLSKEEESSQIRVNLMGDENRRVFPDSAARLCGPVQELRGALGQEKEATWFRLV